MAFGREASPSLCFRLGTLPRAPTAPQTSRGRARNTRFSRSTRQSRQGLGRARPLLGTGNTGVNKRGAVWALQPGGMQTTNREGDTQIQGLRAMKGKEVADGDGRAGRSGTASLGLPWGSLAKTLHFCRALGFDPWSELDPTCHNDPAQPDKYLKQINKKTADEGHL